MALIDDLKGQLTGLNTQLNDVQKQIDAKSIELNKQIVNLNLQYNSFAPLKDFLSKTPDGTWTEYCASVSGDFCAILPVSVYSQRLAQFTAAKNLVFIVRQINGEIAALTASKNGIITQINDVQAQIDKANSQQNTQTSAAIQQTIAQAGATLSDAVSKNLPMVIGGLLTLATIIGAIIYFLKRKKTS